MEPLIALQNKLEAEDEPPSEWEITKSPKFHDTESPLILETDTARITIIDDPLSSEGVLVLEKKQSNNSQSTKSKSVQDAFNILTSDYLVEQK